MERRNRNILVVLIGIVIVVAMLSSFGLGLFAPDTAKIQLPTPGASQTPEPAGDEGYVRVEITPQTVQYVIEHTLSRPESYGRTVTIEDFWGDGQSGVTRATVWVDGGWTHTRLVLSSGVVRHNLVRDGTLYYWYEGSSQWLSIPAEGHASDLSQHIPTYETVLDLDQEDITSAGYDLRGDTPCIYVEVTYEEGHLARYWVGVDSGLLVSAEEEQDGQLVYRMTGSNPSPCPSDASFALPDGTDPK